MSDSTNSLPEFVSAKQRRAASTQAKSASKGPYLASSTSTRNSKSTCHLPKSSQHTVKCFATLLVDLKLGRSLVAESAASRSLRRAAPATNLDDKHQPRISSCKIRLPHEPVIAPCNLLPLVARSSSRPVVQDDWLVVQDDWLASLR